MPVFKGEMQMNVYKLDRAEKIRFFIGLIFLLLAGSRIAVYTAGKVTGTRALRKNDAFTELAAEAPNTIDLAVMGDSESYTTVSPMKLWKDMGIPTYLAGQSGQSVNELYSMLETLMAKQKPKVILLETNLLFRTRKSFAGIQEMIAECTASFLPIFQYHDLWKCAIVKPEQAAAKWKGYQIRVTVAPYTNAADYMKKTDKKEKISWFNLAVFNLFLDKCNESGIKVILYSAPSPVNYSMEKHNALAELAKEKQLTYLDLNLEVNKIGINWRTDTLDAGDHLNVSGTEKVTAYLENILKTMNLDDRRQDKTYIQWNTGAEKFAKTEEKYISSIRSK